MLNVLFFGIIFSVITIIGDVFIKKASLMDKFTGYKPLLIGAIIYGLTAFGWFFLMRKAKLSTLVTIYTTSSIVLMTLVSVFYFKEKITLIEITGICFALVSLIILSKFS